MCAAAAACSGRSGHANHSSVGAMGGSPARGAAGLKPAPFTSCRELYERFYDSFHTMGEPNVPVDRTFIQASRAG